MDRDGILEHVAARRGIARDRALGRNHEALWHDVWIPNERDFDRHHSPRERAEILAEPSPSSCSEELM